MADRGLGAALAQVNSLYAGSHLYRVTRGSLTKVGQLKDFFFFQTLLTGSTSCKRWVFKVKQLQCVYDKCHTCQIIPMGLDAVDLLMTFGIKETECTKASATDPKLCAFRPGFFVVRCFKHHKGWGEKKAKSSWHTDAAPLFNLAVILVGPENGSIKFTTMQRDGEQVKRYVTGTEYRKKNPYPILLLQPSMSCSSWVRVSPSLTGVVSLRCGHDESSSSESSEEVRALLCFQFPKRMTK